MKVFTLSLLFVFLIIPIHANATDPCNDIGDSTETCNAGLDRWMNNQLGNNGDPDTGGTVVVDQPTDQPVQQPTQQPTTAVNNGPRGGKSDPYGNGGQGALFPQCEQAYKAAGEKCVQTANTVSAAGGAVVNQQGAAANNAGTIQSTGSALENSSNVGAAGANVTAQVCEKARFQCDSMCAGAAHNHNRLSNQASANQDYYNAKKHGQLVNKSKEVRAKCNQNLGTMSGLSRSTAIALGVAAVGAGAVGIMAMSGGGDSSDNNQPVTDEQMDPGQQPGGDAGGGLVGIEDPQSFWDENNCSDVVTGKIEVEPSLVNSCNAIADHPEYGNIALGSCAEPGSASMANCFDSLDNYCSRLSEEAAQGNDHCSQFCAANDHADSCTRIIADNEAPANNPDEMPADEESADIASASSSQGSNCAHPSMVLTPACDRPMRQYCSQYGSQGAGCSTFCQHNSGVCSQ